MTILVDAKPLNDCNIEQVFPACNQQIRPEDGTTAITFTPK